MATAIGLATCKAETTQPPVTAPAQPAASAPLSPTAGTPAPVQGVKEKPKFSPADDCVTKDDYILELNTHSTGPQLISSNFFIPAGATMDIAIDEPYEQNTQYFGFMVTGKEAVKGTKGAPLPRHSVTARPIPENNVLVQQKVVDANSTLLTVRIPSSYASFFKTMSLYIYRCEGSPKWVSKLTAHASSTSYSHLIAWPSALLLYVLAALASWAADPKPARWYRYLDPVYLTAGDDGKGSLSKLQIVFFSMIVFGLLTFIVARTGALSDLSSSILMLMGIASVGSAAAKGTDANRNRLTFDNWGWFVRKGWLKDKEWANLNTAHWRDIITTEGEFDVYRYQNCIFSLIVGASLLAGGISELASFTIPTTLLGILGLSQVAYIGGKLVGQTTVGQLDDAVTDLRKLEADYIAAASAVPDPTTPTAGQAVAGPDALVIAKQTAYQAYIGKARNVGLLLQSITGSPVDKKLIESSVKP
jgi:hypothetical protein